MKTIIHPLRYTITLVSLLLLFFFNAEAQVKNLFVEKSLPDLPVQTLDGNKINLSSFAKNGKILVINFWATWCAPCKQELTNIQDLYEDWQKDYDVELLAISIDDSRNISKVKSYVNGNRWTYTVLLDPNQDLRRAFNFDGPPFTVLVDKNGNIVSTHIGYKNGDEFILEDEIKKLAQKQ